MKRKRTRAHTSNNKSVKRVRKQSTEMLDSLPVEIWEKVIRYIPFWHRRRLRRTCTFLRDVSDMATLHEFETALVESHRQDPNGYRHAALEAIKDATWPYLLNGFGSTFCGAILPLMWKSNEFTLDLEQISPFLNTFYCLVEQRLGESESQTSRLLYCITLLRILGKFRELRIMKPSFSLPHSWNVAIELCGPLMGLLCSTKIPNSTLSRVNLLMMLSEIKISHQIRRAFKKVWESNGETFVFGNDTTSKCPTTLIFFKMYANNKLISLLQSCLEGKCVLDPNDLPIKDFSAIVDVVCKQARKWGCTYIQQLQIGTTYFLGDHADEETAF